MRLFDLHCDTATRLLSEKQGLYKNDFHISIERAAYLDNYAQVMAVWSNHKLNDSDAYNIFFDVVKNLENEVKINNKYIGLVQNMNDISHLINLGKSPLILAVEDARILENDLTRLDVLYSMGVRILTLNWYGLTCIGGAHDTSIGLSDFGIEVVNKCFDLEIIPDISHSSFIGADMVLNLAEQRNKPVIASHSNSYSVNPHTRNLRDADFNRITKLKGLVGINLCPPHININSHATISDIISHIEHYLSLGGENTVAIGGDLDGTDLPCGFSGIEHIYKIADELQRINYSQKLIDKIMYKNAFEFFKSNL